MEFPELGSNCAYDSCNKLDFLPLRCEFCTKLFCSDHIQYQSHGCAEGANRDYKVPICPLCNKPVPSPRGEQPDIAVSEHIEEECGSDPAVTRRRTIFTQKCSLKGCRQKEMISLICKDCKQNFCLSHRHGADHKCPKKKSRPGPGQVYKPGQTFVGLKIGCRPTVPSTNKMKKQIQGDLDEDEAYARALAASLEEAKRKPKPPPPSGDDNPSSNSSSNSTCGIS